MLIACIPQGEFVRIELRFHCDQYFPATGPGTPESAVSLLRESYGRGGGKLIRSVPAEDANVEQFLAGELAFSELEDLRVNRDNSDNEFHDPVASGAYTESPPSKRLRSDGN